MKIVAFLTGFGGFSGFTGYSPHYPRPTPYEGGALGCHKLKIPVNPVHSVNPI
jgi:hypothetical protein